MKSGTLSVWRQAAQSDFFSLTDVIVHLDQVLVVKAVNTEIAVGVFQDDKIPIARNRIAAIDDLTRGCGCYGRPLGQTYFYALVNLLTLFSEFIQELALGGPDKDVFGWLGIACRGLFSCRFL